MDSRYRPRRNSGVVEHVYFVCQYRRTPEPTRIIVEECSECSIVPGYARCCLPPNQSVPCGYSISMTYRYAQTFGLSVLSDAYERHYPLLSKSMYRLQEWVLAVLWCLTVCGWLCAIIAFWPVLGEFVLSEELLSFESGHAARS